MIQSRLERMAECILRDLSYSTQQELCIVVAQDSAMRFYRDLLKHLVSKNTNSSFKAYQVREKFVRTGANKVERVWSIQSIKSSQS